MIKDKDGFIYEDSDTHQAMMSVITQMDEVIKESHKNIIKELGGNNNG